MTSPPPPRRVLRPCRLQDLAQSEQFYCDAFGFETVYRFSFLYVDDMGEACARLRGLGTSELRARADEPWGERRAYFADPDGNAIHIAVKL